jgi:hypothetical protein
MLSFRGHFSTKSRGYSTTHGALRAARAHQKPAHAIALGLIPRTCRRHHPRNHPLALRRAR